MNKTLISSIIIVTLNVASLALNAFLILQNLASWQSWSWLTVCILSILISIIVSLITLLGSNNRKKARVIGFLSILPFITNVLACILLTDKVSWVNVKTDEDTPFKTSLFIHCQLYDAEHDPTYPTLYNKCLLLDTAWIINLIASFVWFIMILQSFQTSSYIIDQLERKRRQSIFSKMKDSLHSSLLSSKRTFETTSSQNQNNDIDYTDFKTKKLPPLINRSSDTTLCLPIHTKTLSSTSIMDMKEKMPNLLQPTEEKLEVPDHLFIQIHKKDDEDNDSIDLDGDDRITVVEIGDSNYNDKKKEEELDDEVELDDEDFKDVMTVVDIDDDNEEEDKISQLINKSNHSYPQNEEDFSSSTRRLMVAKSCPNIKKNLLKIDKKIKASDDSILKY